MNEVEFKQQYENPPAWPHKVYVVAGSIYQAIRWAHENSCPEEVWEYVYSINTIRGGYGQVVYYGNWYERRDQLEIRDEVKLLVSQKRLEFFEKPEKAE